MIQESRISLVKLVQLKQFKKKKIVKFDGRKKVIPEDPIKTAGYLDWICSLMNVMWSVRAEDCKILISVTIVNI